MKYSTRWLTILLLAFVGSLARGAVEIPKEIPLWPEGVPNIKADTSNETVQGTTYTHTHHPFLMYYPAAPGKANGASIIFAPGGGYVHVNVGGEGFTQWLRDAGVAVFVLIYRNTDYGEPAPLQDVLRAFRIVRMNAKDWGLDPNRIGGIGNSAGSHVIASAGTLFDDPDGKTGNTTFDSISGRPDFMILTFPVLSMTDPVAHTASRTALMGRNPSPELEAHYSVEQHVTRDTPPTFLVHTMSDTTVSEENTIQFYEALRKAHVPAEMHLYELGTHGSGLSPAFGTTNEWPQRAEEWLQFKGFLAPADTVPAASARGAGGRGRRGGAAPAPAPAETAAAPPAN